MTSALNSICSQRVRLLRGGGVRENVSKSKSLWVLSGKFIYCFGYVNGDVLMYVEIGEMLIGHCRCDVGFDPL